MLAKILYRVLIALALLFAVILAALGLFVHMEVDFTSMAEALIRVSGHPIKAIALAVILLAINTLIVAAFYKNANDKKCVDSIYLSSAQQPSAVFGVQFG